MTQTAKKTANSKTAKRLSWTQPVCSECWDRIKLKTGHGAMVSGNCCFCNTELDTDRRYVIRINPRTVPYANLLMADEA